MAGGGLRAWPVGPAAVDGRGLQNVGRSGRVPPHLERYGIVPRKIRELKAVLRWAGCVCENVKGGHAKWSHPAVSGKLILSGNDGADAKPYQEKMVANYLHTISVKQ